MLKITDDQLKKISDIKRIHVTYPRYSEIIEKIERCHLYSKLGSEPECLFIKGKTSAGKTTVTECYESLYPTKIESDHTLVPVLKVVVPAPAGIKNLVTAMLRRIGDPVPDKGTIASQTLRLEKYISDCGVELIILDEFQHFIDRDSHSVLRTVADWLKNIINNTKKPMVLSGLPEAEQVFEANEQLSRRFAHREEILPFRWDSKDSQDDFRRLLYYAEKALPLTSPSNLASKEIARRIFYASEGYVGYTMKLIRNAAIAAVEDGSDYISVDKLKSSYDLYVRSDKPGRVNPFKPGFKDVQKIANSGIKAVNRRLKHKTRKMTFSELK